MRFVRLVRGAGCAGYSWVVGWQDFCDDEGNMDMDCFFFFDQVNSTDIETTNWMDIFPLRNYRRCTPRHISYTR